MDFESELARLAEPIAPDAPCGESLEDTPTLAAFDAYRIFGLLTIPQHEPDWREIRAASLSALAQSKDFRVLAHFTAAALRTNSLADALRIFPLAQIWLQRYWDEVYPRIDSDAIMRKNALSDFSDRVAIIDALRRLPLVTHPQLGSFSLRDIDIATGVQPNPDPDTEPRPENEVTAAIKDSDPEPLARVNQLAAAAYQSLTAVQDIMRTRGGNSGAVPQLEALFAQFARIQQILGPRIADVSGSAQSAGQTAREGNVETTDAKAVGAVKSRQDAIRALDAVASYFRRNEPTSPVPLLVERAKRMVSMDFLEVIADLAPDALDAARKAAGVRDSQT
jgi:type VI secretion system protein ImpA